MEHPQAYLQHLYRAGVAVVPTCYVEPSADPGRSLRQFLAGGPDSLSVGRNCDFDEFVVKPTIGAGSRDAARYRRSDADPALPHLSRLVAAEGRSAMLQPYLASVETAGETALIYYDGVPSHAFRKGPLLQLMLDWSKGCLRLNIKGRSPIFRRALAWSPP